MNCHRALSLMKCGLSQPSRVFSLCYPTQESRDSLSLRTLMSFSKIHFTTVIFKKKTMSQTLCDPKLVQWCQREKQFHKKRPLKCCFLPCWLRRLGLTFRHDDGKSLLLSESNINIVNKGKGPHSQTV